MPSAHSFSNTQPGPVDGLAQPPAAGSSEHSEFVLAGAIGAQLSEPLAAMQHVLRQFDKTQTITPSQMRLLKTSLHFALTVAKQSQQIARLASGRLRQSHEKVKLDVILRDALRDRAEAFQHGGVELYQNIRPVEVIVDASLLSSLVDAALDWALSNGRRLLITLEIKNWPEHGILLIKSSESVAARGIAPAADAGGDTLVWFLLFEIAQAMGVSIEKIASGHEITVMLEFARTVKRLEGMTTVEMDTGFDSMHGESRPLAGHRVLMITNDERLRMEVMAITRKLGMRVDFAPSTAQGMRFCELDTPHMVIIDERLHDHLFNELREALRKIDPNYPFIEITNEAGTLEVAGWMSDSMTRLGRDALRSQLPSILMLELAKVM